jgi:hypothetical protein
MNCFILPRVTFKEKLHNEEISSSLQTIITVCNIQNYQLSGDNIQTEFLSDIHFQKKEVQEDLGIDGKTNLTSEPWNRL